jgi:hypothetical protein
MLNKMIEEKAQLDEAIDKLFAFRKTREYLALPGQEKLDLSQEQSDMQRKSDNLGLKILAWDEDDEALAEDDFDVDEFEFNINDVDIIAEEDVLELSADDIEEAGLTDELV